MKFFASRDIFPALFLAVGLVVFGVSYTLLGQGPGSGSGESDTQGPVGNTGAGPGGGPGGGNTGGGDPPETPAPNPTPGDPEDEPGPIGVTTENFASKLIFKIDIEGTAAAVDFLHAQSKDSDPVNLDMVPILNGKRHEDGTPLISVIVMLTASDDPTGQVLRKMLEAGANPNMAAESSGLTALHHAVMRDNVIPINLLLTYGANPDQSDYNGVTPHQLAKMTGKTVAIRAIENFQRAGVLYEQ